MKKYLFLIILTTFNLVSSQIVEEFKNINVPSPQAFEMIKYGNISMDESNGVANLNIPIYNYSAGEINIPISLGATTSPLLVNQAPTWTGVNWNLLAGGVITRHVKDQPDDKNCARYNYSYDDLLSAQMVILFGDRLHYTFSGGIVDNLQNVNSDSELDEFNFNFLNYSGSFVIKRDINNNPIVILKENDVDLKVELEGTFLENQDYSFKITTPDGVIFKFGGYHLTPNNQMSYGVEETKFFLKNVDPTGTNGYKAKTAFYLTSIESYKGDIVYFDYETLPQYEAYYYTEQKLYNVWNVTVQCGETLPDPPFDETLYRQVFNLIENGKILFRIRNSINLQNVVFESNSIINNGKFYGKVLSKIKFEAKEVELNYIPNKNTLNNFINNNTLEKFFLTETVFYDSSNQINNKYKIEYNDLNNVPLINSFSQDHLGYFNGQVNTSLFPKDHYKTSYDFLKRTFPAIFNYFTATFLKSFDFTNHNSIVFADRDGYFEFATKGIIKKMIYPSGGYTSFEYQPEILKPITTEVTLNINHNPLPSGYNTSVMEMEYLITNFELDEDNVSLQSDFIDQTVEFKLDFGAARLNQQGYNDIDYRDFIYVKIVDLMTNEIFEERLHVPADQAMDLNLNEVNSSSTFMYYFKNDHNYKIKIGFGDNIYNGNYINQHNPTWLDNIAGNLSFKLITGYDPNDGIGVRIKKTIDFDSDNSVKNVNRFYYKSLSDVVLGIRENRDYYWLPEYNDYKNPGYVIGCPVYSQFGEISNINMVQIFYDINVLTTNSNASLSPSSFHNNKYKFVTIVKGEEGFENGAIQKEFRVKKEKREFPFVFSTSNNFDPGKEIFNSTDSLMNPFPVMKIIRGFKNNRIELVSKGEKIKESFYKKSNNKLIKTKDIFYQYTSETKEIIGNININVENDCPLCVEGSTLNLYIGLYDTKIKKNLLTNILTKEYIDGIPLTLYYENFKVKENKFWDFDNDGIPNYLDYITENEFEEQFKYVSNNVNYWYGNPSNNGLKEKEVITLNNGDTKTIKYFYPKPNNITQLSNLNSIDNTNYQALYSNYKFDEPIQIQEFHNNELLTTKRLIYSKYNNFSSSKPLLNKIYFSKGTNAFEYNHEISKYDDFGNIAEIKVKDLDQFTSFQWYNRKLKVKAENMQYSSLMSALNNSSVNFNTYGSYPMLSFVQNNPNSFFTFYSYDQLNLRLQKIFDSNYNMTQYIYDAYYNLNMIKDNDGNIVKEFEQQFKPQN